MRVAQINVTYGNADSTGRNVKELHEFFLERGVDSHVYVTTVNDCSKIDKRIHFFSSSKTSRIMRSYPGSLNAGILFIFFDTKAHF